MLTAGPQGLSGTGHNLKTELAQNEASGCYITGAYGLADALRKL